MGDDITEGELQMIQNAESQWSVVVSLLALGDKLREADRAEGEE